MISPQRWLWGPRSALGLSIALAVFLVDQIHKWWMLDVFRIAEKGRVEVTPFLDLLFVKNTGISYSLFDQSGPWGQVLLAGFAGLASIALWIWLARDRHTRLAALGIALIIGGALANALDRLRLGGVADFFLLHAYGYSWYIFNIADAAIVAGVAGLLYDSLPWGRARPTRQGGSNMPGDKAGTTGEQGQ